MATRRIRKEERERLFQVRSYILHHLDEELAVPALARRAALSLRVFNMAFRQLFGMPAGPWVHAMRMGTAKFLLLHTEMTVTEVAGTCGYAAPRNFSSAFKKFYGQRPGDVRPNNGEEAIPFPVGTGNRHFLKKTT